MNESTVPRELLSPSYSESQGLASDGETLQRAAVFSTTMKKKANILMVDDEPGKLLGYEAILSSLGKDLIRATSGAQALEQLLKNDIAVVLLDVKMPDIDGFQLADLIRQHPRFDQTALIFVSALHMTDSDRLKGYERGAVDYISVPVIPEILRAKVKLFVELRRKSQELEEKNKALGRLSRHLMVAQDVERRRIARNLHDSLGQYLASAKMSLDVLSPKVSPDEKTHLSSALECLEKCITETRTISQLLHPPLLDEGGLVSAARLYVESFAQRSGIEAKLNVQEGIDRLPELTEVALFRVLQESLTNIHRHSGSPSVEIQFKLSGGEAMLIVRDFGHGIPETLEGFRANGSQPGVGLSGMRERINDLGGKFEIRSDVHGTAVIVRVPVPSAKQDDGGNHRSVETSSAA
jgi:signal transduction histidine kinase